MEQREKKLNLLRLFRAVTEEDNSQLARLSTNGAQETVNCNL